ncbi:MAG: hypothetical protein ACI90X_000091, partial [Oceanospirillaceae bacterium]
PSHYKSIGLHNGVMGRFLKWLFVKAKKSPKKGAFD